MADSNCISDLHHQWRWHGITENEKMIRTYGRDWELILVGGQVGMDSLVYTCTFWGCFCISVFLTLTPEPMNLEANCLWRMYIPFAWKKSWTCVCVCVCVWQTVLQTIHELKRSVKIARAPLCQTGILVPVPSLKKIPRTQFPVGQTKRWFQGLKAPTCVKQNAYHFHPRNEHSCNVWRQMPPPTNH